ncbi:MAG: hypothetical protein R2724_08305 [Bryobacterales bacterium]
MADACDALEQIDRGGCYARITVHRSWSRHNPATTGQIARPSSYRWYLERELAALLEQGAEIEIAPSRERVPSTTPSCFAGLTSPSLILRARSFSCSAPSALIYPSSGWSITPARALRTFSATSY